MSNWVKKSDVIEMIVKMSSIPSGDLDFIEKEYVKSFLLELTDYAGTHGEYRLIRNTVGFLWVNIETKEYFTDRELLEKLFIPRADAIPIERLEQEIDRYIDLGLNSVAKELRTIVDDWRKENESNIGT